MRTIALPILVVFLFCASQGTLAQQVMAAGNGSVQSAGYSLHCSLGQVFYNTVSDDKGGVFQGIQLPHEYIILDIPGFEAAGNLCVIYPNPAGSTLIVKMNDNMKGLHYFLCNSGGKLLMDGKIGEGETRIGLEGLAASMYILTITGGNGILTAYKIIKK